MKLVDQFIVEGNGSTDEYVGIAPNGVYARVGLDSLLLHHLYLLTMAAFFKLPANGFAVVSVYQTSDTHPIKVFNYEVFRSRYLPVELGKSEREILETMKCEPSAEAQSILDKHFLGGADGAKAADNDIKICCNLPLGEKPCNGQTQTCMCPSLYGWHAECVDDVLTCKEDKPPG